MLRFEKGPTNRKSTFLEAVTGAGVLPEINISD